MQREIPFDSFAGIMNDMRPDTFDPQKLERITIFQGLNDGKSHTVYIDMAIIALCGKPGRSNRSLRRRWHGITTVISSI